MELGTFAMQIAMEYQEACNIPFEGKCINLIKILFKFPRMITKSDKALKKA